MLISEKRDESLRMEGACQSYNMYDSVLYTGLKVFIEVIFNGKHDVFDHQDLWDDEKRKLHLSHNHSHSKPHSHKT